MLHDIATVIGYATMFSTLLFTVWILVVAASVENNSKSTVQEKVDLLTDLFNQMSEINGDQSIPIDDKIEMIQKLHRRTDALLIEIGGYCSKR